MMQTFLIQTFNGKIKHDFSFHLIEAINYQNWFYNEMKYRYETCDDINNIYINTNIKNYIPIGSVEFVLEFLAEQFGIENVKPINIPLELRKNKYLKRHVQSHYGQPVVVNSQKWFVKSEDKIKGFTNILNIGDWIPEGNFLMSDLINIESEWRIFIFNNRLVGLQNYSGDFIMFPDIELIQNMVNNYINCPPVYTLDVGINKKDGTFIIEVHNFFSCGLYGFADYRILPQMFIQAFKYIKN